jgi:hypothetical protein
MLSMNRQMHQWWSKGFFAIKCLGIIPQSNGDSTIQLQFHWMQRRIPQDPDRKINLDRDIDDEGDECEAKKLVQGPKTFYGATDILGDISGKGRGIVSAANASSSRLLHSGHVFEIQMPAQDAENMKAMLDFQWACIQISVMSGAAGWPDFLAEDDDDDDDDALVGEWLETASFTSLADPSKSRDMSPEKRLHLDPETSPE